MARVVRDYEQSALDAMESFVKLNPALGEMDARDKSLALLAMRCVLVETGHDFFGDSNG